MDLHSKPFDEGTIAKLEIFEQYAEAWIPTFVMQGIEQIYIFDFFAGTGYDKNGIKGSPIRVLDVIKRNIGYIFQKQVKINVCFNEFEPNKKSQKKYESLKKACDEYLVDNKKVASVINLELINEDFEILFPKKIGDISKYPSLVYLDQNGIKFLSKKYLLELEKMTTTDFLYFTSSSYFKRFGESDEFKQYFEIDTKGLKNVAYVNMHRFVINELKQTLPRGTNLKLYPFTIKKGKNIYGIIFGAKHPLAVDKFLNIAWKHNEINGEANFDIDDEANLGQQVLFGEQRLSKIQTFNNNLKDKILSLEITDNTNALNYAHQEGHIGKHAANCLKELKKNKLISFDCSSPLVTYDNVYKNGRILQYKVLKK